MNKQLITELNLIADFYSHNPIEGYHAQRKLIEENQPRSISSKSWKASLTMAALRGDVKLFKKPATSTFIKKCEWFSRPSNSSRIREIMEILGLPVADISYNHCTAKNIEMILTALKSNI